MKKLLSMLVLLAVLSSVVYANHESVQLNEAGSLAEDQTVMLTMDGKKISRIEGENRFQTATALSESHWDYSEYVVIARGDDYADALAATGLAAELKAPLLLAESEGLQQDTANEIERLQAEKAIVLGGSNAIKESVVKELQGMDLTTTRIYGETRFETGVEIATYLAELQGKKTIEEAFLVLGTNFPDALSIAPEAAKRGAPILLTNGSSLHPRVEEFMETYDITKVTAIGGENTISPAIVEDEGYERISGSNRYVTALNVAKTFETESDRVLIATGRNFPDALSAGVFGALTDQNIILVNNQQLSPALEEYLLDKEMTIIGGENAVPMKLFVKPESEPESENVSEPEPKEENFNGIALTFDDRAIKSWYAARDLFNEYDAVATFYVDQIHRLNEEEKLMLQALQSDGHEIAGHSLNHLNAVEAVKNSSLEKYIQEEIRPSREKMGELGIESKNFAYPYGARTTELDQKLLEIFDTVRGTVYTTEDNELYKVDRAFFEVGSDRRIIFGVGIDNIYGNTQEEIKRGIDRGYENNEVLVVYGHAIVESEEGYVTKPSDLEEIMKYVNKKEMRFHTISSMIDG